MKIEVVYSSAPRQLEADPLDLHEGACVLDAVRHSGVLVRHSLDLGAIEVGVWGRRCTLDRLLQDGDRVELYRPLRVDPKEARRVRYKGQRPKRITPRAKEKRPA